MPYVTVAILSCAHLTRQERETEMKKVQSYGVKVVLGTIGEDGSYVLYDDSFLYAPAVHADDVIDTMGAGDSYFAAFLCSLLETSQTGAVVEGTEERMKERLVEAMERGAAFAAKMCAKEGAFGYGVPVSWGGLKYRSQVPVTCIARKSLENRRQVLITSHCAKCS